MIARFIGVDEVIEAYEKQPFPMFSVWIKTQIVCQYNGNSFDEGTAIIKDEIERNIKRKLPYECIMKIHAQIEKSYSTKSDAHYTICFKSYEDYNTNFSNPSATAVNYEIINRLNAIESKQNAIIAAANSKDVEDNIQDDEDINISGTEAVINGITAILNHPLAILLTDKLMTAITPKQPQQTVTQLSGTYTNQERINSAVETLFKKGLTVEKLEALAKMPALKIKSLLTMI